MGDRFGYGKLGADCQSRTALFLYNTCIDFIVEFDTYKPSDTATSLFSAPYLHTWGLTGVKAVLCRYERALPPVLSVS